MERGGNVPFRCLLKQTVVFLFFLIKLKYADVDSFGMGRDKVRFTNWRTWVGSTLKKTRSRPLQPALYHCSDIKAVK